MKKIMERGVKVKVNIEDLYLVEGAVHIPFGSEAVITGVKEDMLEICFYSGPRAGYIHNMHYKIFDLV